MDKFFYTKWDWTVWEWHHARWTFAVIPAVLVAVLIVRKAMAVADERRFRRRLKAGAPIAPPRHATKVEVVIGDITTEHVDVIVNAAKASLMGGGGVDGAIHRAGGPEILRECEEIRRLAFPHGLPVGDAVVTLAGNLPADFVVHTVGPMYHPTEDRGHLLRSCYTASLAAADAVGASTVAFPLISSGVYGWPVDDAIRQALSAIRSADTEVETVRLVLFDAATYRLALEIDDPEGF